MSSANLQDQYFVEYEDGRVWVSGAIDQRMTFHVDRMLGGIVNLPHARSIDLLCIAAGCYGIDRSVKRIKRKGNDNGTRTLKVCFRVSDLAFWQQPAITEQLAEILVFLTGDAWLPSFAEKVLEQSHETQQRLDISWPVPPTRVALYSGGLDSAAGLAARLLSGTTDYLLLTIGHQSSIRRSCLDQIKFLRHELPEASRLAHANLLISLDGGKSERLSYQEQSQRVRGFLFCAAAAVVANGCDIQNIDVFENGVGAINLPLMEGMLTDGLSTRGAHPAFLEKMTRLVSAVFGSEISYVLPFLANTKAEVIGALQGRPRLLDWAQWSRSCIHTSIRKKNIKHCGICAACIERRQAFIGAGVIESPLHPYGADLFSLEDALLDDYLRCYLENATDWVNNEPAVSGRLHRHLVATDLDDLKERDAAALYLRHARETLDVFGKITRRPSPAPQPLASLVPSQIKFQEYEDECIS